MFRSDLTFLAALQNVVGLFQRDTSWCHYQILSFSHGLENNYKRINGPYFTKYKM